MAAVSRKEWMIRFALIFGSLFIAFVLAEVAYRIRLANNPYKPMRGEPEKFAVSPIVFGLYDRDAGVRYAPGSSHHVFTAVEDGRIIWAPDDPVAACNRDGFVGKTLRDEYARAELKIVTFGDSFTNWIQDGDTWPDLLQAKLAERRGKTVGVLNSGRGGYGILQMFDLAALTLGDLKPDLAIIAFISDDLSRSRWWTRAIQWNGFTRPLQSPSPENFDLSIAIDEYIVNSNASLEWAQATVKDPAKGQPLLGEVISQYQKVRDDFHRARGLTRTERSPWTLHEIFLWNRITTGLPVQDHVASIPRVTIDDFGSDRRFVEAVKKISALGVPVMLVHLPTRIELRGEEPSMVGWFGSSRRDRLLWESLEKATGQKIVSLRHETEGVTIPEKMDLLPFNGHPNRAGLEMYAELIARAIERRAPKAKD